MDLLNDGRGPAGVTRGCGKSVVMVSLEGAPSDETTRRPSSVRDADRSSETLRTPRAGEDVARDRLRP